MPSRLIVTFAGDDDGVETRGDDGAETRGDDDGDGAGILGWRDGYSFT